MSIRREADDLFARLAARLAELKPLVDEYDELRPIAERLGIPEPDGMAQSAPPAQAAAKPKRKPKRAAAKRKPRARRSSSRKDDTLRVVREHPGVTVAEVGAILNTDATQLYRWARELADEGLLRKDGTQYFPIEPDPQPEAPPAD